MDRTFPSVDIDWYQDMVAKSPDIIDIVTREGIILYSNTIEQGTATAGILGTPIFTYFSPKFHEKARKTIADVMDTGHEGSYETATRDHSQDNTWYMVKAVPIFRNGQVIACGLCLRNITRLKEQERALSQLREQQEQSRAQREHELNALYEIVSVTSESKDSADLLKESLEIALRAMGCEMGIIHWMDQATGKLTGRVAKNFPLEFHNWLELTNTSSELWEKVFSTNQIITVNPLRTESYHEKSGPGVRLLSYAGIPIHARHRLLGVLSIFKKKGTFSEEKTRILLRLSDQIGLSLESLEQRKQGEEALIVEERQRLARDLHDSVSQSLYGLMLSADIGKKFLKMKAYPELTRTLDEIGDTSMQSLKEMRLMLFELRPLSFDSVGLAGALDLRLNTVEKRAGMKTELRFVGENYIPEKIDLEIYRIITEALNNSLKHSFASKIAVELYADRHEIRIVICDNGEGFAINEKPGGGIGLNSMRERTTRLGGEITIRSKINEGTSIEVWIPLKNTLER